MAWRRSDHGEKERMVGMTRISTPGVQKGATVKGKGERRLGFRLKSK